MGMPGFGFPLEQEVPKQPAVLGAAGQTVLVAQSRTDIQKRRHYKKERSNQKKPGN